MNNTREKTWLVIIAVILSVISVCIKLDAVEASGWLDNLGKSFQVFKSGHILLIAGIVALILYAYNRFEGFKKRDILIGLFALAFSILQVVGYSFDKVSSLELMLSPVNGQFIKTILIIPGYTIITYAIVKCLFDFVDKKSVVFFDADKTKLGLVDKHPFAFTFITLIILYLPYAIASYPCTFQGDAVVTILPAYKESSYWLYDVIPLAYSFFVRGCMEIGNLFFDDANAAVFLVSLVQSLGIITMISFLVTFLKRKLNVRNVFIYAIIAFYGLLPLAQNYLFLLSKDVLYEICLIGFCLNLYMILSGEKSAKYKVGAILFGLGMFFLRNEAPYVMILLFAILLFASKGKRAFCTASIVIVAIVFVIVQKAVFPLVGAHGSDNYVSFSVPAQQIARCVYYDKELTEEEMQTIGKVFHLDRMKDNYIPTTADPIVWDVKATANSVGKAELLKTWAGIAIREPGTCIQATMNNYYAYFFCGGERGFDMYNYSHSAICMSNTSELIDWADYKFEYPESFADYRGKYWEFQQLLARLPVLSAFMTPAFYFWALLLIWLHKLCRKNKDIPAPNIFLIISTIILMVCFTAPANGYYARYEYPIIMIFPVALTLFLKGVKDNLCECCDSSLRQD